MRHLQRRTRWGNEVGADELDSVTLVARVSQKEMLASDGIAE